MSRFARPHPYLLGMIAYFMLSASATCMSASIKGQKAPGGGSPVAAKESIKTVSLDKIRKSCLVNASALKELTGRITYITLNIWQPPHPFGMQYLLTMPLYQIKFKTFLKPDTLVLLPKGAGLHEFLLTCGELRQAGFKHVFVVKDGLIALTLLHKNAYVPLGDRIIDSRQFYIERNARRWIIVQLKHAHLTILRHHLPTDTVFIKEKQLKSTLRRFAKSKLPIGILFVDNNGEASSYVANIFHHLARSDIYYLKNGVAGFVNSIRMHHLITSAHVLVSQKFKSCGQ